MDLAAIFFLAALLILVSLYLAAPFLSRSRRNQKQEEHEISALMAERDRVINALQELDFDFNLGKIPAEDYPLQRAELLKKGAEILRKLDALTASPSKATATTEGDAEARLEQAVAARRADAAIEQRAEISDDDLEALIAARRKQRVERSAGFCPRCGKAITVADRFCPSCGKSLV
jgi:ribosomal protein S27AE